MTAIEQRIAEVRARSKQQPESRRRLLEASSETYRKYGFTGKDAEAQGVVIAEKRIGRDGKDFVLGYRARNAADTTDLLRVGEAVDDYFRRYAAAPPVEKPGLADMTEEEALSLANEVVGPAEILRRRRVAIKKQDGRQ